MTLTAAVLLIGDELLSGATQDKNLQPLAQILFDKGIMLKEVRILPDDREVLVPTLRRLSGAYTYVFTSGGIGPTHDDITVPCVAEALNVPLERNEEIVQQFYEKHGDEVEPIVLRMADYPQGAELFENGLSTAPGFRAENIYVSAGMPIYFQAMVEAFAPSLKTAPPLHVAEILVQTREGRVSGFLGELQAKYPEVQIGSYPRPDVDDLEKTQLKLVFRGRDTVIIEQAVAEAEAFITQQGWKRLD